MPPAKLKPSDIAVEAKRTYIPYIDKKFPHLPAKSYNHLQPDKIPQSIGKTGGAKKLRVAVIDGDAVDVALDWSGIESKKGSTSSGEPRIPLILPVDDKRPGGDWESGSMAPEENLARRSNLVPCLNKPSSQRSNYPIPLEGGIYSPNVVIFRSGSDSGYSVWEEFLWLPVISVAPVKRPKLDESGENYSFEQEKELMKQQIRTALRIAASWHHKDVCVGAFGTGSNFRHPVNQLATMWKEVLFSEAEFKDAFANVVFALSQDKDKAAASSTDFDVFKREFDPANVCRTSFR